MDPRLWELLSLPPGSVYIRDVRLCHTNSTVIVDCDAVTDADPNGTSFQLTFKNCRDVHWEAVDPYSKDELVQAFGVYLGEEAHNKPAVIYTGITEMTVLYDEVQVRW